MALNFPVEALPAPGDPGPQRHEGEERSAHGAMIDVGLRVVSETISASPPTRPSAPPGRTFRFLGRGDQGLKGPMRAGCGSGVGTTGVSRTAAHEHPTRAARRAAGDSHGGYPRAAARPERSGRANRRSRRIEPRRGSTKEFCHERWAAVSTSRIRIPFSELAVAAVGTAESEPEEPRADRGTATVSGAEPKDRPLVRRTGSCRRTGESRPLKAEGRVRSVRPVKAGAFTGSQARRGKSPRPRREARRDR